MVKLLLRIVLYLSVFSCGLVGILKWVNPPITAFMIQAKIAALRNHKENSSIHYEWVNYQNISPYMPVAVIAAEDQNFPHHHGFDFEAIEKAFKHNTKSKRLRGASTISQQVAKNLFLWSDRSFLRKGLEAYFTGLIELLWGKKRILEVYLNVVELGDRIFGVQAASEAYFRKPAKQLNAEEAALLAAILPNPARYSARNPSAYVRGRKSWILRQINLLGGSQYLKEGRVKAKFASN